jgi:hypothetical protein
VSTLDAYVDESVRSGKYLMCVVLVEPRHAGGLRVVLQDLLLARQRRLHFQRESRQRRRQILDTIIDLDVSVAVFTCRRDHGRSERAARAACLAAIVKHLQSLDREVTMYIERREGRDTDDHRVVNRSRRSSPALSYQHIRPGDDPLIWLPDCFAWPVGAGGAWLAQVRPAIAVMREVG